VVATRRVVFESDRRFEVWDWGVGHRGLALRANPTPERATRIEVIFKPAHEVCLPSWLDRIRITATDGRRSPDDQRDLADWENLYLVDTVDHSGWVIGGTVAGRSDHRSYDAPKMFDGRAPAPGVENLFQHLGLNESG
jgi:hypothetical protein